jgi:predicted nuclease with TOPRIM domain|tara:strand:- start:2799 stop:3095 length:297 start_codon:yes stop_codon:yes gene_type:complete
MFKREDIEKQIGFLDKDVTSVQERIEAVRAEETQLVSTLASLNGAIQVSNHYLSMMDKDNQPEKVEEDKMVDKAFEEKKKKVEAKRPVKDQKIDANEF